MHNASKCDSCKSPFNIRSYYQQSFGIEVERVPTPCLMDVVNRCVQEEKMTFLHSYNDLDLITGHARCII